MGPIVHTRGWSGSRLGDPDYSGVPGGLGPGLRDFDMGRTSTSDEVKAL